MQLDESVPSSLCADRHAASEINHFNEPLYDLSSVALSQRDASHLTDGEATPSMSVPRKNFDGACRLSADGSAGPERSAPSLSLFTAVHADADRLRQRLHDEERRQILNARQARAAASEDNRRRDALIESLVATLETLRQMVKSLMDNQVSPDVIAGLSQRIDAAHELRSQFDARQSSHLGLVADEVKQLAKRIDHCDEALGATAAMQRSVFDHVVDLGQTQSDVMEDFRATVREEMQRAVAAEIAKLRMEDLNDRSATSQLRDELNAVRTMRSAADHQLRSILSLLGDSLERVSNRVVTLEEHACDGIGVDHAGEPSDMLGTQPQTDRIGNGSDVEDEAACVYAPERAASINEGLGENTSPV